MKLFVVSFSVKRSYRWTSRFCGKISIFKFSVCAWSSVRQNSWTP